MNSTEGKPVKPEIVGDPAVPIVDIPPDERVKIEIIIEASGDVKDEEKDGAKETTVVETVTEEPTAKAEVKEEQVSTTQDVNMENAPAEDTAPGKRDRADAENDADAENGADAAKRLKSEANEKEQNPTVVPVKLGPKLFHSGIEMFTYFYDLLHGWVSNVDFNKYEHMVLTDLLTKGHRDAESKIGPGIQSFQIRYHTGWRSRCYFLIRTDGSAEDFSYRKCVDRLMPLPESLFTPSGDIIVEKLFGDEGKWDKKGKGKRGEKGGKDHQGNGNKAKAGGGGWKGGKGGYRDHK
ncbi:hypothetical protein R1sor_027376 [Riccia sorocarpa]|uniref:Uncharacterized protein n=1 Tax=Riccia sorocarpa TaxID=122646 RepID=A0ABD3GE07_9MARC